MRARGALHLLELQPGLTRRLQPEEVAGATRTLTVPLFETEAGPVHLHELADAEAVRGAVLGVLVVKGLLTIDVWLRQRTSTRVVAPGDLLLLDGMAADSLPSRTDLQAHSAVQVAVLDDRLPLAFARWPRLVQGFTEQLAMQHDRMLRTQAISQLPRVEDRLLGLLWSLADEQGAVRADGVFVAPRLTHLTLGRMIGAKRPTVSLGLHALEEAGDLRRLDGGYLLDPASAERFGDARDAPPVVTPPGRARGS